MHQSGPPHTSLAARLLRLVAVTMLAPFLVVLGATNAQAADDGEIAWAVRTASNQFGEGRQNYSYTLDPGGTIQDGIVITNHGEEPLVLAVYAADGFTTTSGQLDLLTQDVESTGVGGWVQAERGSVRIKGGDSVTVPFSLSLPDDATPGDYMGGIITSLSQPGTAGGMNVDRRLAIRIRLRVGGDLRPGLSVENLHVSYSGTANPFGKGSAKVEYTIHNTGNAILAAHQDVTVSGPFGRLRTDADAVPDMPELMPGETWQVSVPVRGVVPAVRLAATVTLTPLLVDSSGSTSQLEALDATTHTWTLPWTLVLLLLAGCGLVAFWVVVSRRRRAGERLREAARVQEAVDEALRERESSGR